MKRLIQAANFAALKHKDQRRKDKEASPYINHPLALALVLSEVSCVPNEDVIIAALLHDTIEDTDTTPAEITHLFGDDVLSIVLEVTDDKSLPKAMRKQLQIEHAPGMSVSAKLVKLADKICNLRDMAISHPEGWSEQRVSAYFEWAKAVVDSGLRGVHAELEALFDAAYSSNVPAACPECSGTQPYKGFGREDSCESCVIRTE
jgi:guanosine-3',5'-bis(diphosphate) 3'-pyrophosphohydrolase